MKKLTYEAGMEELTGLVEQIEDGQLTLEETIKAYEKGNALAEKLNAILAEGKGRILKLEKDGSQTPLDAAAEDDAQ